MRSTRQVFMLSALAAIALVLSTASTSEAGWRRWCARRSCWGCGCGFQVGYGWAGSFGSYGSYGSYGSAGSYGSYGSYGSFGASYGSYGNAAYSDSYRMPSTYQCGQPVQDAPSTQPALPPGDTALLNISLPEDAKVYVNGQLTGSVGTSRRFRSRDLAPGVVYSYQISAVISVGGEPQQLVAEKTVQVRGGQVSNIRFDLGQFVAQNVPKPAGVETTLVMKVPENARVFLAGAPTKATGSLRTFTTKQLSAGEKWADYVVRVEVEQDGKMVSKEQTLELTAGEKRELSIEFPPQVAASK